MRNVEGRQEEGRFVIEMIVSEDVGMVFHCRLLTGYLITRWPL